MAKWYLKVGENVGLALTRLAPIMGSLLLVSLFWGEYYAIPGGARLDTRCLRRRVDAEEGL